MSFHSNTTDMKIHYTRELIEKCKPIFRQGIRYIFSHAKKNTTLMKHLLKNFQEMLEKIPNWNSLIIQKEFSRFKINSNCQWLDKLIKAAFLAEFKIAAQNIILEDNFKLDIPKSQDFIHFCYIEIARDIWAKPQICFDGYSNELRKLYEIELDSIIQHSIMKVIKNMLPLEKLVTDYLKNVEDEVMYNSDEDEKVSVDGGTFEDSYTEDDNYEEDGEVEEDEDEVEEINKKIDINEIIIEKTDKIDIYPDIVDTENSDENVVEEANENLVFHEQANTGEQDVNVDEQAVNVDEQAVNDDEQAVNDDDEQAVNDDEQAVNDDEQVEFKTLSIDDKPYIYEDNKHLQNGDSPTEVTTDAVIEHTAEENTREIAIDDSTDLEKDQAFEQGHEPRDDHQRVEIPDIDSHLLKHDSDHKATTEHIILTEQPHQQTPAEEVMASKVNDSDHVEHTIVDNSDQIRNPEVKVITAISTNDRRRRKTEDKIKSILGIDMDVDTFKKNRDTLRKKLLKI